MGAKSATNAWQINPNKETSTSEGNVGTLHLPFSSPMATQEDELALRLTGLTLIGGESAHFILTPHSSSFNSMLVSRALRDIADRLDASSRAAHQPNPIDTRRENYPDTDTEFVRLFFNFAIIIDSLQ